MKNLLRLLILAFFFSMGLLSCGKDTQPAKEKEKEPAEDGSLNNDKPNGGKYVEVELVSTEPDWNNIKVGETVTLKFKVIAPFDESQRQYSMMSVRQTVDSGGDVLTDVTVAPVSAPYYSLRDKKPIVSSTIADTSTNDPIYMQVTITPSSTFSTTITISTAIISNHSPVHRGKEFQYKFTPKQ